MILSLLSIYSAEVCPEELRAAMSGVIASVQGKPSFWGSDQFVSCALGSVSGGTVYMRR